MNPITAFLGKYITAIELAILGLLIAALGLQTLRLSATKTELAQYHEKVATERQAQQKAALDEAADNARETLRRLNAQQENQRAQDAQLAAARADAVRNAADADRVRQQSAAAAREWSARLGGAPSREDVKAAAAAIDLLADVRSRMDAAAGQLAGYADAARAAGAKCERDYDALTETKK